MKAAVCEQHTGLNSVNSSDSPFFAKQCAFENANFKERSFFKFVSYCLAPNMPEYWPGE